MSMLGCGVLLMQECRHINKFSNTEFAQTSLFKEGNTQL